MTTLKTIVLATAIVLAVVMSKSEAKAAVVALADETVTSNCDVSGGWLKMDGLAFQGQYQLMSDHSTQAFYGGSGAGIPLGAMPALGSPGTGPLNDGTVQACGGFFRTST